MGGGEREEKEGWRKRKDGGGKREEKEGWRTATEEKEGWRRREKEKEGWRMEDKDGGSLLTVHVVDEGIPQPCLRVNRISGQRRFDVCCQAASAAAHHASFIAVVRFGVLGKAGKATGTRTDVVVGCASSLKKLDVAFLAEACGRDRIQPHGRGRHVRLPLR